MQQYYCLFYLMYQLLPLSTLFPYTTLFRSPALGLAIATDHARAPHVLGRKRAVRIHRRPVERAAVVAHTHRCVGRSEEHTSELQSLAYLVCRLLLEKKNIITMGLYIFVNDS